MPFMQAAYEFMAPAIPMAVVAASQKKTIWPSVVKWIRNRFGFGVAE